MKKHYKHVKCKLKYILLDNKDLVSVIEKRCFAVSRMAVKASLFCNLMIEMLIEKEIEEWPDFSDPSIFTSMFIIGNNKRGLKKPIPAIEKTWEKYKNVLQENAKHISRYSYDISMIECCAKTYQESFFKNLRSNFALVQRKALGQYLKEFYKYSTVYALQCIINNWDYKGQRLSSEQLERLKSTHWHCIEKHRRYFPEDNTIDIHKLKPKEILEYFNFLKWEYKNFESIKLVPVNEIKAHYVNFDCVGVKGLCSDIAFNMKSIESNDQLKKEGWYNVFNLEKINNLASSEWTFDRCIATDGVACSIRYWSTAIFNIKPQQLTVKRIDEGIQKRKLSDYDSTYIEFMQKVEKWSTENEEYNMASKLLSQTNTTIEYLTILNSHQDVIWRFKTTKKWRNAKYTLDRSLELKDEYIKSKKMKV